jgi:hypothetical protein
LLTWENLRKFLIVSSQEFAIPFALHGYGDGPRKPGAGELAFDEKVLEVLLRRGKRQSLVVCRRQRQDSNRCRGFAYRQGRFQPFAAGQLEIHQHDVEAPGLQRGQSQ